MLETLSQVFHARLLQASMTKKSSLPFSFPTPIYVTREPWKQRDVDEPLNTIETTTGNNFHAPSKQTEDDNHLTQEDLHKSIRLLAPTLEHNIETTGKNTRVHFE